MADFDIMMYYSTYEKACFVIYNNYGTGWTVEVGGYAQYYNSSGTAGSIYYISTKNITISPNVWPSDRQYVYYTSSLAPISSGYYYVHLYANAYRAGTLTHSGYSNRYYYPYQKLYVESTDTSKGTAVWKGNGSSVLTGYCGYDYNINATPKPGYEVDYWYPTDTNTHWPIGNGVTATYYNFSGYQNQTEGYTSSSKLSSPESSLASRTAKVVFKQGTLPSYTLTYNGNGNSGGTVPSAVTQVSGTSVTLSGNVLTKSSVNSHKVSFDAQGGSAASAITSTISYSQNGWNSNSAGTGTHYNPSSSYTISGNATIYAQWSSTQNAITLPSTSRTGYTFAGWYNSSGTYIAGAGSSYTPTSAITLYAHWTANTYTVSFNQQSGSGGTSSVTAYYGSAMPGITKPTRTGYTFQGYYTSTGGGGTKYYNADGSSARAWDKTSATTLYAYWTANTYSVTLNANGGSGGTSSVTATYASAMPSISVPSRSGFTFTGYFIDSTKYYNADGSSARNWDIASTGNVLWAGWTRNQYTVSYNANGGVTTATSQTDYYENSVTLAASSTTTRATKTNATYTVTFNANGHGTAPSPISTTNTTTYTFSKWALNSTSGTKYNAGASYTIPASNSTMYAIWNENTSTAPISLPVITDPDEQYILAGWSTNSSSSSGVSGSYTPTSNVTLYAIWAGDYASVTFNGNGGLFKMADGVDGVTSQTVPVLKKTFINLPHEGWKIGVQSKLIGWKSSVDNVNYLPGAKVAINNDATFTAIWYDYFYWTTNEASDAINIASGKPITNALASKWNTLKSNLITYVDSNISVGGNVSSGDEIVGGSSSQFSIVVNRLGVSMTTYQTGDPIYAIDFIGVRDALNAQARLLGGNPGEE